MNSGPDLSPSWFDRLSPLHVLLLALVVGEALTALIVVGFSLVFRGEIAADYLIIGAATCLVVASLTVTVVQRLGRRLSRTQTQLTATQNERDVLQHQLLQAQKLEAIGELAGGIAHDFNNLLGGMLSNVAYLQELEPERLGHAELAEVLADLQQAGQRGASLTNQLLTFARRAPSETTSVPITEVVEAVLRLHRRTFDKSIVIATDLEPGLHVRGDPGQLQQVLMNLCLNARDAMPTGGSLTIRARAVPGPDGGDAVEIQVADAGAGMDAETARRAFEPFFTRKESGAGSGLGLAVVYGIVTGHGGTIDLHTEPGEGTRFTIAVPAAAAPPRGAGPVHADRPADRGGRVLLVDDEPAVRRATERLLTRRGYRVTGVEGGADALCACAAEPDGFDLVLLDLAMPEMDGEQTFTAMRAAGNTAPVILISGYDGGQRIERVLAAGAAAFLAKPFDPEAFDAAIQAAIHAAADRATPADSA